ADEAQAPVSEAPATSFPLASAAAGVELVEPIALAQPATPAPRPAAPATTQARPPEAPKAVVSAPFTPLLNLLKPPRLVNRPGGPAAITAEQIVTNAESLMDVPYVWGGVSDGGLDCSAFVSRVWGVGR